MNKYEIEDWWMSIIDVILPIQFFWQSNRKAKGEEIFVLANESRVINKSERKWRF